MCVVTAELRLLLLHAAEELCCVLYDVPHYDENKMPRKALYYPIIFRVYCCTYLVGKVPTMYLFWEKPYFTLVVTYFYIVCKMFFSSS